MTRPLTALVAVRVGGSRSSLTTKALARLEEKGPRLLKVAGTGQEVWHTKEPPDRAQGKSKGMVKETQDEMEGLLKAALEPPTEGESRWINNKIYFWRNKRWERAKDKKRKKRGRGG